MKWVGSLGLIKYNADAKNRPVVGLFSLVGF